MRLPCFLVLLTGSVLNVDAADWPQWRGPHRDGVVDGSGLPARWPKVLARTWKREVGEGHASPVVAGERVFIFSRQGNREVVRALGLADGREFWRQEYKAPYKVVSVAREHGKGPKSTPVVSGDFLVTFGINGILTCWKTSSGQARWRREFSRNHATTAPLYGQATSPIVDGGRVIVHVGGHDDGALLALKLEDGTRAWQWDEDGPAYASPILVTVAGTRQLITQSQKFIVGLDPATGRVLWKIPFKTQFDQNSVTPVWFDGRVIIGGYNEPTVAYRLLLKQGRFQARKDWSNREIAMYMSSPVLANGRLYGLTQRRRGQLFCVNPVNGKSHWGGPGRLSDNAALIVAGQVLLVLTVDGELLVLRTDATQRQELARYKVSQKATWAHPALVGSRLLVKDVDGLTCFSLAE